MNAEFNVWLLIVGLVVGAGLVWLVMMDGRRRETDIDAVELPREAAWLSAVLAEEGHQVSPETAEEMLLLHRAYVGAPPPDPVEAPAGDPWANDGEAELPDEPAAAGPDKPPAAGPDEPPAAGPDAPAPAPVGPDAGQAPDAPSEAAVENRVRVDR